jgi:hypothetical protein
VKNPKKEEHDYNVYTIYKGDSLVYNLTACLKQNGDSLQMEVDGYQRVFKIKKINCNFFTLDFNGMWIPEDPHLFDAMEGYNFRKKIVVLQLPSRLRL